MKTFKISLKQLSVGDNGLSVKLPVDDPILLSGPNKVVKCTRCKHVHSLSNRINIKGKDGWFHLSCPKCTGRITTELIEIEYEIEVSKQQKHYPVLKGIEIRPDWIHEAFKAGVSPIEFLNDVVSNIY